MKHLALALFAAVALSAQPSGTISNPDAYAVYNAVIPSNELIRSLHATELLIQDTTEVPRSAPNCAPSGPGLTAPWRDALTNFNEANAKTNTLSPHFSLSLPYRLEPTDTIRRFFKPRDFRGAGWTALYAAYPNAKGYLMLSAVGFDKTHEHATVYMTDWCGNICGQGEYHFLLRTDSTWRVAPLNVNTCSWIS